MKRAVKLSFIFLFMVSCTTGCWNLKEPDQLAFFMGTGLDFTKDGQLQVSSQIVIPSRLGGGQEAGGGAGGKSFRVISAIGKNIYDTVPNLQKQLSRNFFIGHRQIILIGQRMAEQGIGDFLDQFVRNPQSEQRSRIFVVKDGQAKDILSVEPFFEPFTSTALVRQQETLGLKRRYFRNFLSDTFSQGLQPMMPAVSLTDTKQVVYSGTAIFNKDDGLKLVGFLNIEDSFFANWIANRQTNLVIASFVKRGNGNISLNLRSLDRRIQVKMIDKQIKIDVLLTGKGTIVENNTNLDPTKRNDLQIIEDEVSETTQRSVQQLVEKVQKQYKTDIFGFGVHVHQQYPEQWKTLKRDWNVTFPELNVSVKVHLQCKDPGETNSSIKSIP
ncbi:Ger(x)C family spore germination protein [Paenibacillus cremeus]|uniref:Ger(X)C family spore germination protein n=1 Tax=Paenibacillus cremeus TaxID=2163881 RepID=A0A559K4W5_9BACL|nr:Ger(x)C family spore germination protein [Paenibacillus cremeus]TVY07147.1 Ger(x)C family spore germination protein [Paenibacillus cremeus]